MLSCVPNSLQPHRLQHTRLLYPPLFPRVFSNSHPLSWWCCLNISSSVSSFSFCLPSFLASGCFSNESALHIRWPKYWSFSISPSNEYSVLISFRIRWFDLLAVQGLSRVFSSTSVWKHQFFSAQPSLWSGSHIHTWLLEKPFIWTTNIWTFVGKVMSLLFNVREVIVFRPGSSRFWFRCLGLTRKQYFQLS